MNDTLFKKLLELISKKDRKININDNPLLKEILGDVDTSNTKLSDISLYHSCIDKEKYTFNIIVIPRKIPVKKPNSNYKLDFEMKQYYYVDLTINNDDSYCSLSVDKCDNRKGAKHLYLNWKDYISNNNLNTIFENLIDKVKK